MNSKSNKVVQFQPLGSESAPPSKERLMFSRSARSRQVRQRIVIAAVAVITCVSALYVLVDWSQVNDKLDFIAGKRIVPIHHD